MTQTKAELLQTRHQGDIRLGDADSTNYVGFKAPATVGSNLVWTLPATDGSANQFLQTNASGVLSWGTADTSASMPKTGGIFTGNVTFNDNVKARFGTGADLEIYHGGTDSIINNNTGDLYVQSDDQLILKSVGTTEIRKHAGDELMIKAVPDGAVELYHNNNLRLQTWADGVNIHGDEGQSGILHIYADNGDNNADKWRFEASAAGSFNLANYSTGSWVNGITLDGSNNVTFSANATITGDLTVSGTTTTINTQTLDVEDKNVVIGKVSSPSDTTADGGGWTLKGATDKTFNWVNATDAWTSSEHIHLIDTKKLFLGGASGTTDGLELYHSSSHSYITNSGTGNLYIKDEGFIRVQTNNYVLQSGDASETLLSAVKDGAVELYHNNVKKIETTSGGINVTGAINVNGAALSTAPTITATASGAITANTAVHMNTNGTVQIPTVTARAFGSLTGVQSSSTIRKAFWDSSAKIIIVLYTTGSSQPGARVGSVSGTTITWGTAFDLSESSTFDVSYMDIAVDEDGTYVVVMRCSSSPPIRYCMFTVSDLAITMTKSSTSAGYESINTFNVHKTSNNEFVLVYESGSSIKARKGTRSGNSISWASGVNITTSFHEFSGETAYSSSAGKILVPYSRSGFWYRLLTVSSMSAGSEQELYIPDPAYQGNTGNWDCIQVGTETVIVWEKNNENSILGVRVATMGSNANSVTWGTAVDVSNNNIEELSGHYNSVTGKVVVTYKYSSNLYYYREITLSGTGNRTATVSAETQITTSTAGNITGGSVADSVTGADIFNLGISGWSYRILAPEGTTLTADNFVGFASAAYTNGQTATINVIGNTITQSGLTAASKYYVKKNGTVSTTVDNPSVEAGIALTSTKLLIKG
jgi:hypothetical protein